MINRCVSCGAPAPANRSDFHFTCEFCGTYNVDQEYLLQKAKSGEIKTQNKYFESALLAIDSGDYEKASKLIEEALNQDSNNQDALIYQAFCSAALIKPSNFEKNLKISEVALNRAKNINENESYELGKNQVTNMFLEQSPNAANYFFDTAKKKLLAYGSETNGKIHYLTEMTRGINVFKKIIELNPTNLERKVSILIIALDKIHECEDESSAFSNLSSNSGSLSKEEVLNLKNKFYSLLYEINTKMSDVVNAALEKSIYSHKIRRTLKEMAPKNANESEEKRNVKNTSSENSKSKNWIFIGIGAIVLIVIIGVVGSKDKNNSPQQTKSQETQPQINKLLGKNSFEFFSDAKAMQLITTAVGEKNVDEAKHFFMVSNPSIKEGSWIVAEGCMPRSCDTNSGIIMIDIDSTKMIVGMYDKDKNQTRVLNTMGLPIKQIDNFYTLETQTPQKFKDWLLERGSNFRD